MPEVEIDLGEAGRGRRAPTSPSNDESHQVIEEFMLAANEAVADVSRPSTTSASCAAAIPTPSRASSTSSPSSPAASACTIDQPQSRFELQRVLAETAGKPEAARRPLRPAAQPEAGQSTRPSPKGTMPWPARTTATSRRRSAAIPTSRSTAS